MRGVFSSSLDIGDDKIEMHRFSFICPIDNCREKFTRYSKLERHLFECHDQHNINEFTSKQFVFDEKVKIVDKSTTKNTRGKMGQSFKRVSKEIQK